MIVLDVSGIFRLDPQRQSALQMLPGLHCLALLEVSHTHMITVHWLLRMRLNQRSQQRHGAFGIIGANVPPRQSICDIRILQEQGRRLF